MKLDGSLTELTVATEEVGFVTEVSFEESAEVVTEKYLGGNDEVEVSDKTYTFSSTHTLDNEDVGQNAMVVGETVDVLLYPFGNTAGKREISFSAVITKKPMAIKRGEKTKQTIEYQVNNSTFVDGLVGA
ncbi:hypothetical protein [Marinicellulosiphila megalodicopiae]|uniref:hypothetical protein n=1 Tax=Marinicellulosiphila megalodicopiae TaxID=2724896 RepID=UPI003BB06693